MNCPRCGLSVQDMEYEGQKVSFCAECWGIWLTRPQLNSILSSTEYKFSRVEKEAVLETMVREGDADREGSESQTINCPVCSKVLEKKRYDPSCPVIVDECDEHGIWLDTGEIKDLQIFLEKHLKGS